MTSDRQNPARKLLDDGEPVSVGGFLGPVPTPEQLAAFEVVMREANQRFLAAALAEDGMPISAGWRGPDAQPKSLPPTDREPAQNAEGIVNAPS